MLGSTTTSLAAAEGKFIGEIIFGGITAAVVGIVPALITVLVLVALDFITGIWAAIRNKVKIESHKMRATACKLLAYLSVIVLAAMIDGSITGFNLNLGSFTAGFLGLIELTSIVENFGKITGHDAFERLKDLLGKKADKIDK